MVSCYEKTIYENFYFNHEATYSLTNCEIADILSNEIRDALMYKNTYHQLQAKEYCKDHQIKYSDHKCKPHWCGDCDYLIKYEIEIQKR